VKIEFQNASDGELFCTAGQFKLHSSYDPSKEARRFVESVRCDFSPLFVLVSEPALSYSAEFLRERFPKASLACIRFCDDFFQSDKKWDKIFYAVQDGKKNKNLSEEIFDFMGDEGISACLFLSWKPSEKPFAGENDFAWSEIKKSVLKSRSVLATRAFFSRRWTKNALRFCLFTKKNISVKKGNVPVVICASGESLEGSIPFVKKFRQRFFLIALSSSLPVLLHHEITPDLCISTDGGFWAKLHLSHLLRTEIPLALPGEASCFACILEKNPVLPLFYGDGTSEEILRSAGFSGEKALRNGSVSGTAANFALSLTEGEIFFLGLDLSSKSRFPHARPNELDEREAAGDFRFRPAETRIVSSSSGASASLEIYRSWFSSGDFGRRIFRLSDNFHYDSELKKIRDVNWSDFEKMTEIRGKNKIEFSEQKNSFDMNERLNFLRDVAAKNMTNPEWIKNALPGEWVILQRCGKKSDEDECMEKIRREMKTFFAEIMRALGKGAAV
jgi:hypothetical protein